MTTGPPRSSSYAEGAARETRQLDRWKEAVAYAERVGGLRLLGAWRRTPVRIGAAVDHLLDPSVALGTHDDAPVAERHAVAHESRPVSDRLAQELRVPARRAEQADHVADAGRRARLEHGRHVRAVAAELRRKSEREGAAAREDDLAPRQDALRLDERLRPARGDDAGKRPAREGDGTVVGAGRDHDPAGLAGRACPPSSSSMTSCRDRNGARARQQLGPRPLRAFDQRHGRGRSRGRARRARDPEARARLLEDLPAERRPLVDDSDREARGLPPPLLRRVRPGRRRSRERRSGDGVISAEARGWARECVAGGSAAGHDRARVRYLQAGIGGSGAPIGRLVDLRPAGRSSAPCR